MATGDKFIQGMLELLDKLIQQHGQNTNLLGEIKSNLSDLRSESRDILSNLKDKLPDTFAREQDIAYEKLSLLIEKIENSNSKLNESIENYDAKFHDLKVSIDNSCEILNANSILIKNIHDLIVEKETQKQEMVSTLQTVNSFISGLKSKRMWMAAVITGIAALATAFSSVVGAWEKINTQKTQQTNINTD